VVQRAGASYFFFLPNSLLYYLGCKITVVHRPVYNKSLNVDVRLLPVALARAADIPNTRTHTE
jgi:hypothetical protein